MEAFLHLKSYASKEVLQLIFGILTWKSDNFHSKLPQILIIEYLKFPKHFLNQFWNFFKIFVKNLLLQSANLLFWLVYLQIISVKNFRSLSIIKPAVHLSRHMQKWMQNAKNNKCIAKYFAPLFSQFCTPFPLLAFHSMSQQGWHSQENWKDFVGGFCGINKTRNSHEMRKVYSECFLFHCVFREKHLWNAKCENCVAGLTDMPQLQVEGRRCVIVLKMENNLRKFKRNSNNLIKIS